MELLPEDLSNLPLHTITDTYGTEGLSARLSLEVEQFSQAQQWQINQAFWVAAEIHKEDKRSRGQPYLDHLLRVTIRIISHYSITDVDVITAALLHDSVEDHALELGGTHPYDYEPALRTLSSWFNPQISTYVASVTNPRPDPNKDKIEHYLEHVEQELTGPLWQTVIIKMSDFTDNGVGIFYSATNKARESAPKYVRCVNLFRVAIERPDIPVSKAVRQHMRDQLDLAEKHLALLIDSVN